MKTSNSKKRFVFSLVVTIVSVAMLVGATFAWFTDSVTSGKNKIIAGNLDVELYAGETKVDENTKLFDDVDLWEPGAVAYETLTVKNVGTLALKYQMSLLFENETKVDDRGLSEVLKVGTFVGAVETGATREEILAKISNFAPLASFSKAGELNAETDEEPVTYVIYWEPSDNDNLFNMNNDNQGKELSIDIGVNLVAGQNTVEADSFDELYDLSAFTVVTPNDFNEVIANLKGGEKLYFSAGTFSPTANETLKILKNDVTIVGSGKDVTVIDAKTFNVSEQAAVYVAGDNVTIANLTIKSNSDIGNVSPIKVTGYMADDAGKVYKNFKLDNVALEGNKGHGLNLHGVDGAVVNNVDIRSYGKCGISCAKATNVTIKNTKIAAGGWGEDLSCMYSSTEGNIYNSPCSITFGEGNTYGNGFVKTERPSTATGGTDIINGLTSPWIKSAADDGTYSYQMAVAKIGDNYYQTFQKALNAATEGDTITLLTPKLTVSKYIGNDSENPYGKYTEISDNQGTKGEAMEKDKLANVVLRRKGSTIYNKINTSLTIEGYSPTEYTELGSLDFSGSANITVKYLKFDSQNAVKAIQVYDSKQGSDNITSKEGVSGITRIIAKEGMFANIIDANYRGMNSPSGDGDNSGAKNISIENCIFVGDGSEKHASVLIGGQTGGGSHPTNWTIKNCKFETKHIYGYLMLEYMSDNALIINGNTFGASDSEGHYNMMTGSCTNMMTKLTQNKFNLKVNDSTGELVSLGGNNGKYEVKNNIVSTYGSAAIFCKIKNCSEGAQLNDIALIAGNAEQLRTTLSSNNTGITPGVEVGDTTKFGPRN